MRGPGTLCRVIYPLKKPAITITSAETSSRDSRIKTLSIATFHFPLSPLFLLSSLIFPWFSSLTQCLVGAATSAKMTHTVQSPLDSGIGDKTVTDTTLAKEPGNGTHIFLFFFLPPSTLSFTLTPIHPLELPERQSIITLYFFCLPRRLSSATPLTPCTPPLIPETSPLLLPQK